MITYNDFNLPNIPSNLKIFECSIHYKYIERFKKDNINLIFVC